MNSQTQKIKELLVDGDWHCVNEFIDTYCVDYRRRITDLKEKGYILDGRKCELHDFHRGGSKMWRLIGQTSHSTLANFNEKPPEIHNYPKIGLGPNNAQKPLFAFNRHYHY